jgi:two-component system response regulator HydG
MNMRSGPRVLVVDDNLGMAQMLSDGLAEHGFAATPLASGREAVEQVSRTRVGAVVTDLRMPDIDGLALLAAVRKVKPDLPVIVMTAYGAVDSAVECIRQGAFHYLTKPFKLDELVIFLTRALEHVRLRDEADALKAELRGSHAVAHVIRKSKRMRAVIDVVQRVATSDAPLLILGETGTGKGLIARAAHGLSGRAEGPFVTINCAAVPESLLESELFGHTKGAFTGATAARHGLFEEARGGTLFLDEIGEMPLALQAKLLDVLERQVIRPVGSSKEQKVDVRIMAATHRDLQDAVRRGTLREDLFYRLDVVSVMIPALRHRRDDILPLLHHFLAESRGRHEDAVAERFAKDALERMLEYSWPGNVRELQHTVERLVLLVRQHEIPASELPRSITVAQSLDGGVFAGQVLPIRELQRRYAVWALDQMGGHRGRTAERLGVDAKTLAKWLADADDAAARSAPARKGDGDPSA